MLKNKINKINSEKIKGKTEKLLWFIGNRAFLSFAILFLIAILLNAFIFYIYVIRPASKDVKVEVKSAKLNETLYQNFLKNYKQRQESFNQIGQKVYLDPFSNPSQPNE